MVTWLGDPRTSLHKARETAKEMAAQLDNPAATPAARRELREALAHLAYTGRTDFERLEHAVTAVFEAGYGTLRRAVGHPDAALMSDSVIYTLKARLIAADLVQGDKLTDDEYYAARRRHRATYAEYAAKQHRYALHAPAHNPGMYQQATAESTLNASSLHLLTAIGLSALYPEGARQVDSMLDPHGPPWGSIT
jgi:hypothetical protein